MKTIQKKKVVITAQTCFIDIFLVVDMASFKFPSTCQFRLGLRDFMVTPFPSEKKKKLQMTMASKIHTPGIIL